MTVFRLEAERAGAGPHLFPRVFATIEDACTYAEAVMDRLAGHPAWRVRGFRVVTVDTRRRVTTIPWHDPDDDPDPFAPGVERGPAPASLPGAAPQPPVPARGHAGTETPENVLRPQKRGTEPVSLPGNLEWQIRPVRRPGSDE